MENALKKNNDFRAELLKVASNQWDGSDRVYLDFIEMLKLGSFVQEFCRFVHDFTLELINKNIKISLEAIDAEEARVELF